MALSAASVRPFGRAADLDVAFERVERPFLITALLAQCSEDADAEAWWTERISSRMAALLRLAALSDEGTPPRRSGRQGTSTLTAQLRCPQPACGSEFEIELPSSAFADAPAFERIEVSLPDGRRAIVRQPTGEDQRRWSQRHYASPADAVTAIVDALLIEGQVATDDERSLSAIAAALADHDPLIDFTVSCACPACAQPIEMSIDLEGMALARLSAVRQSLLADVHVLASAYGWTEREVLALPAERRASYRALIEEVGR